MKPGYVKIKTDLLINPPGIILDDSEVINKIWNYVESTRHLSKKELRKIMRGLVRR